MAKFKYNPAKPYFQILVPTTDTTRYSFLLETCLEVSSALSDEGQLDITSLWYGITSPWAHGCSLTSDMSLVFTIAGSPQRAVYWCIRCRQERCGGGHPGSAGSRAQLPTSGAQLQCADKLCGRPGRPSCIICEKLMPALLTPVLITSHAHMHHMLCCSCHPAGPYRR